MEAAKQKKVKQAPALPPKVAASILGDWVKKAMAGGVDVRIKDTELGVVVVIPNFVFSSEAIRFTLRDTGETRLNLAEIQ